MKDEYRVKEEEFQHLRKEKRRYHNNQIMDKKKQLYNSYMKKTKEMYLCHCCKDQKNVWKVMFYMLSRWRTANILKQHKEQVLVVSEQPDLLW